MISEIDIQSLKSGKRGLSAFFRKISILCRLNAFIKEAGKILKKYKNLDYRDYSLSSLRDNNGFILEEKIWSTKVSIFISKIFNNPMSCVSSNFNNIIVSKSQHAPENSLSQLIQKREFLLNLKEEIKAI